MERAAELLSIEWPILEYRRSNLPDSGDRLFDNAGMQFGFEITQILVALLCHPRRKNELVKFVIFSTFPNEV
jgi:hypothetical protein